MTRETGLRRRIAIVDGTRRLDLVVPAHATVAAVLDAVGVHARTDREVVMETGGREIAPAQRVGDLRDGAVLVLADLSVRMGSATARTAAAEAVREAQPPAAWWVLGGAGAVLAVVSLASPPVGEGGARVVVGAFVAVAAVLAGVFVAVRAPRRRPSSIAAPAGILLLAFAAGTAVVPGMPAARAVLAVFTGMLLAAVIAGAMSVVTRSPVLRAQTRVAMTGLLVLAAVWGAALLLHADVAAPAAVTLGLVPPAQRVLLAGAVDVPPGTFIDYERFQTTRWTVRQQLPDAVRSIDGGDADALVARSTARLTAGVSLFVAAGAASAPFAVGGFDASDPLVLAGRIALAVTVVFALLLGGRSSTVPALRWVARGGALAVVLSVLVALMPAADATTLVIVAAVLLVVGAASAFLVVPAGRGVRSLTWSRLADVIESLAVALSLPAALLAAGAVELMRGMMAG